MSTSTKMLFKAFKSTWFCQKWVELWGSLVNLKATGFTGNLDGTITDVQLLANRVDTMPIGGLPDGTENETLRKGATDWEATDILQVLSNYVNILNKLMIDPNGSGLSPTLQILPGGGIGVEVNGYLDGNPNHLQDGVVVNFADRTGILINSPYGDAYKPIQAWNSYDGYTDGKPNVQFEVDANGKIKAWKKYKKSDDGVTKQVNNVVVDELGNFLKQDKNIGIVLADQLITSGGWAEVPDMHVHPIRSNYYHCQFRFVLKRLMQAVPYDTFGASGIAIRFTNDGAGEIEIMGGIDYDYQYSDGINDQVNGCFDNMNFTSGPYFLNNPGFRENSTVDAEYLIISGDFVFLQASNCDNLKCYVVKQVPDEDYTIEKGSFMKITLKNEG